jgi:hypothetical protein
MIAQTRPKALNHHLLKRTTSVKQSAIPKPIITVCANLVTPNNIYNEVLFKSLMSHLMQNEVLKFTQNKLSYFFTKPVFTLLNENLNI